MPRTKKRLDPQNHPRVAVDDGRFGANGQHAPGAVLYVVGGAGAGPDRDPTLRDFPLVRQKRGQSKSDYLARVAHRVAEAMAAGGTHLLVPREHADWLGAHPMVADYFAEHHEVAAANGETGIVFALRPPEPVAFTVEVEGWEIAPGEGIALFARRKVIEPKLTLRPTRTARGQFRGRFVFSAEGLCTMRLAFTLTRPRKPRDQQRQVVLSLARPGYLFHDLPFVEAVFDPDGSIELEFDLKLDDDQRLKKIRFELVEEDNWRVHPAFPGGSSFARPAKAPAGARLALRELTLAATPKVRKGPPYGVVRAPRSAAYRKPAGRPRDAVIFSSWVPKEGLVLGDYFIQLLCRWHADSKIFVGIDHGSSPKWRKRLEASGLDVTIQPAASTLTMPFDPTGFVAALDAYRRHEEPFDLLWFGHTKGGDHLEDIHYATGRWTIERTFWSRREEIERYFDDATIGLYAPHYLMMTQSHLRQSDALLRMFRAPCAPLGAMAVSTHFVLRDESVRDFCARVDKRFFRYGPEPFGADRFFFEMAMPNVALMQGFQPFIEPGLGGTSGRPKMDGVASILNDWRQNNAVVAVELEKWRQDPTRFRTRHAEHNGVA